LRRCGGRKPAAAIIRFELPREHQPGGVQTHAKSARVIQIVTPDLQRITATGGGKMAEGKNTGCPFVVVGIGLGAVYWFIDSLLMVFLTENLNLFHHLLSPDLGAVYRRLVVLCLMVLFGSHCQTKLSATREEAAEWMAYAEHLEAGGPPENPE
jgi:hypothetical protein